MGAGPVGEETASIGMQARHQMPPLQFRPMIIGLSAGSSGIWWPPFRRSVELDRGNPTATMKDTIVANAEQALPRTFDLIVYGASGFTGRLVAEHLLGTYGATGEIKWTMAGRNTGKLAEVRDLIGGPSNLPLIAADASNPASLKAVAESAKVIISTVGPYQLYGEGLVAACAAAGLEHLGPLLGVFQIVR
jgi:hypothetical protein